LKINKQKTKQQTEKYIKHEMEKDVWLNVRLHNRKLAKYAKKNAVSKAAEVISLIEKMALNNPTIKIDLVKNKVIDNLVTRD
jgi:hypothetical protein